MNAPNSHNKSDAKNIDLLAQQLKRIYSAIDSATKKGLYEVMIYETIGPDNTAVLKAEGYQVNRRGGRMGEENSLLIWNPHPDADDPTVDTTYYPGGITPEHPSL